MLTVPFDPLAALGAWLLASMVVDKATAELFEQVIAKTWEMARRSLEKFAQVTGMNRAQLHRQLSCDGHFSVQRLCKDIEVLRCFAAAVLLLCGQPEFVREAKPARRAGRQAGSDG